MALTDHATRCCYVNVKPFHKPIATQLVFILQVLTAQRWTLEAIKGEQTLSELADRFSRQIEKAITNRREVEAELKEWETKSAEVILGDKRRKA